MNKTFLLIGGSYGIGNKIIDLLPNESEIIVASRTKEGLLNKNICLLYTSPSPRDLG